MPRARQDEKPDALRSGGPQIRQQCVLDVAAARAESFPDAVDEHAVRAADNRRDLLTRIEQRDVEHSRRRRLCRTGE